MSDSLHPTTKEVNRKQIELSNKAKIDALTWLSDTFPEAFNTEFRVRPLKKGIMDDVFSYLDENQEPDFSRSKLREAVVMFTRRMEYLVCLKCRNNRIDLKGVITEEVTEEEAKKAADKIKNHMTGSFEKNKRTHDLSTRTPREASFEAEKSPTSYLMTNPLSSSTMDGSALMATTGMPQGVKTQVTIKRKIAKRIDPEAVARMKAKLGIGKESA